jgi:hypothetical protein
MDLEVMIVNNELIILKKVKDGQPGVRYEIVHQEPRKRVMFPREWEPERYFFHVDGN